MRRYVRKLRLQDGAPPTLLAIAPGPGMLVAHSWAELGLHVFNVNGQHLVSCTGNERLSALAVTPSGHFLLTGGLRGVVSLHWLHSLEVLPASPCRFVPFRLLSSPVSALHVTLKGVQKLWNIHVKLTNRHSHKHCNLLCSSLYAMMELEAP